MKNFKSVEKTQVGVTGVLAQACIERPWAAYVAGVRTAPMSAVALKQGSARMTLPVSAAHTTPRKDDFARSGIRTQGPPV